MCLQLPLDAACSHVWVHTCNLDAQSCCTIKLQYHQVGIDTVHTCLIWHLLLCQHGVCCLFTSTIYSFACWSACPSRVSNYCTQFSLQCRPRECVWVLDCLSHVSSIEQKCTTQVVFLDDVLLAHHLEPAEGPGTTGLIELCLSLPAATTSALIRIEFQKAFLTVFDHPPDAHRGFDIPAALLTFLHVSPEHQVSTCTQTFTAGLASRQVWHCNGVALRVTPCSAWRYQMPCSHEACVK